MSAFGSGSTMTLGLRLAMKDDTQGVIGAATSAHMRFRSIVTQPITVPLRIGRSALALARDVQLGLAPIISGIDRVLERGGALEVQQRAFESLTGRRGRNAVELAKHVQAASSGILGLGESMALANRALSSGMGIEQLAVAIEFIGKKSIATGKDARQALDTVITGLIRGSTLFLDDFGILVDGVEAVKRSYDAINGKGAFESLGPAAQKAETVRQAIAEMRMQMDKIGISGRETVFTYTGIKTAIGDATDKLVLAAAKSERVKGTLEGVRDVLRGMSEHFEKNGSIEQILFGKGKSAGLFGVFKGFILDAGEALGRGIIGGALIAIGAMPSVLKSAGDIVSEGISSAVSGGILRAINSLFGDKNNPVEMAGNALTSRWVSGKTLGLMSEFNGTAPPQPSIERFLTGRILEMMEVAQTIQNVGLLRFLFGRTPSAQAARHESIPYDELVGVPYGFGFGFGLQPGVGTPAAAAAAAAEINKFILTGGRSGAAREPSIFERMHAAGRDILSSGIFGERSRGLDALRMLQDEFAAPQGGDAFDAAGVDPADYALTAVARRSAQRRLSAMRQRLQNIERGGGGARQAALRRTGEVVARLRRAGRSISPGDRGAIFSRLLEEEIGARGEQLRSGIGDLERSLDADDGARRARREGLDVARNGTPSTFVQQLGTDIASAVREAMKPSNEKSVTLIDAVNNLTARVGQLVAAFGGSENEMAKIAGTA